jgi:hypothetical protein
VADGGSLPVAGEGPKEKAELKPLSLGEYMFSEDSQPEPEPPAAEPAVNPANITAQVPAASFAVETAQIPGGASPYEKSPDLGLISEEAAGIKEDLKPESEKVKADTAGGSFEGTRDFGVPDIDALIRLSQEEALPADTRADSLPKNETPQASAVSEDEKGEPMDVKEEHPEKGEIPNLGQSDDLKGIEEAEVSSIVPPPNCEEAIPQTVEPAKPEQPVAEAAKIETSSPQEFTLRTAALEPPGAGLMAGPSDSSLSPSTPPSAAQGEEDKTMVIPPSISAPEGDKTVIYESGAGFGIVPRGGSDLESLAVKAAPEGIPSDRLRTVAFLYAAEDSGLCADLLSELDAICLKSPSKPMFINRAFVQACEPGNSGNVLMQKVTDAGAVGLICVGNIHQDTIYEVENVFAAGGMFFRHLPRESLSHSAALDLVTEFILK